MRELRLSVAPSQTWRSKIGENIARGTWQRIRKKILVRDNYSCYHCEYKAEKYQIVHHIDGNPQNNHDLNLRVVCPDCNKIVHCGLASTYGYIAMYLSPDYTQLEVILRTREYRAGGLSDNEIIKKLGLLKYDKRGVAVANDLLEGIQPPEDLVGFVLAKPKKEA